MKLVKLTSIVNFSVSIEDIRVYLPGRGCTAIIQQGVLLNSRDYARCKSWVKTLIIEDKPMPFWPFISKPALKLAKEEPKLIDNSAAMSEVFEAKFKALSTIEAKLNELLARPIPVPQIIHQTTISKPTDQRSSELFIPNNLIPTDASSTFQLNAEVNDLSIDESLEALKKMKKKKS